MNFLNSNCLSRYGKITFWSTPYFREAFKPNALRRIDFEHKPEPRKIKPKQTNLTFYTTGQRVSPLNLLWTQIRYQKGCPPPKFHRDLDFPNFDAYRKDDYTDVRKTTWASGDGKPGYTYVVGFFGFLCGSYALKTVTYESVLIMAAPADVLALASVEVDISKVAPGGCMAYKWRGKPLFIKNRTEADIELEAKTPVGSLRDPETEEQRCVKPEWLVVIGICTHLGCVPIPNSGDWSGGFYCPCHGSHYDNIGRARKGPAPTNLEVPPYKFISDTMILVG